MRRLYLKLLVLSTVCVFTTAFSAQAQEQSPTVEMASPEAADAAAPEQVVAPEDVVLPKEVAAPSAIATQDGGAKPEIAEIPAEASEIGDVAGQPSDGADELDASIAAQLAQDSDVQTTAGTATLLAVPEVEIQLDVFAPEFMASLLECRKNKLQREDITLEIVGLRKDKCRLKYGHYELNVPTTLLNSIHSFDDLEVLLKNKDITRYKYLPQYVYNGLIYALNSCAQQEKYWDGAEEEETLPDAIVTRGLSAEYKNNTCFIYLQNELNLDLENAVEDYGYTCRLPQETIDELMPYFEDIIAANKEPEDAKAERPKEVRDADIALMYYLQQNNYCAKNRQSDNNKGEQ